MTNEFIENANKCANGDLSAMRWMFLHFEDELPDGFLENEDKIFIENSRKDAVTTTKEVIANMSSEASSALTTMMFWLNRAAFYGDSKAIEYIKLHPLFQVFWYFPQEFYYGNTKLHTNCSGEVLRKMGILSVADSSEFTLESLDKYRFFKTTSYAGYEGPDEDGFGMEEEYNFSFYDEFFNPLLQVHSWSERDLEGNWNSRLLKECLLKKAEFESQRDAYWASVEDASSKYRIPYGCIVNNGTVSGFIGSAEIKENVVLPDGVAEIGNQAFIDCESIRNIRLSKTLEKVGEAAFQGSGLEFFEWPVNIPEIPSKAFWHCHNLKHITIPDGVKKIGFQAFLGCWELEDIYIPDSVVEIGEGAFRYCKNLKSFHWPAGIQVVPNECFGGCLALQQITLPEGVTSIGENAFSACNALKNINLPKSVSLIGKDAFCYSTGLVHVDWPETVPVIAERTFEGCRNLKVVIIPSSVKEIHPKAFSGCKCLQLKKPRGILDFLGFK